jgi:hypothetical protein
MAVFEFKNGFTSRRLTHRTTVVSNENGKHAEFTISNPKNNALYNKERERERKKEKEKYLSNHIGLTIFVSAPSIRDS